MTLVPTHFDRGGLFINSRACAQSCNSSAFSAKVKNKWKNTSSFPYAITAFIGEFYLQRNTSLALIPALLLPVTDYKCAGLSLLSSSFPFVLCINQTLSYISIARYLAVIFQFVISSFQMKYVFRFINYISVVFR
jgi:hypothetical protein